MVSHLLVSLHFIVLVARWNVLIFVIFYALLVYFLEVVSTLCFAFKGVTFYLRGDFTRLRCQHAGV